MKEVTRNLGIFFLPVPVHVFRVRLVAANVAVSVHTGALWFVTLHM